MGETPSLVEYIFYEVTFSNKKVHHDRVSKSPVKKVNFLICYLWPPRLVPEGSRVHCVRSYS
jgi:hypothetical protein